MTVRRNRALDRCLRYVTKCLARSCRTLQLRNGGASIWPLYNDMLHSLSTLMLALLSVVVAVADQQCSMSAKWFQKELKLPAYRRGCHLITNKVLEQISGDMSQISTGLCHVFIQHTSASLTINENADPDVRTDMETWMNKVVPEGPKAPWVHTDEGYDDMPAHCKASMMGASLTIPITAGRLNLGTWQGIWLCEHRDSASGRRLVVTLQGQ